MTRAYRSGGWFRRLLTVVALVQLIAAVGCTVLPADEPDTCDAGGFLLLDDFSEDQDCGWSVYNRGAASVSQTGEALQIEVTQPGELWWSNPGRDFDDVILTAEATQVSGPDDNAYGLICRYQNEENFYVFLISGDGYYTIAKYQSGSPEVIYLTENREFQESDLINRGAATNRIQASCIGNQLGLSVNGLPLVTVSDPTFVTGDVGVAASTLQPGSAVVQFDNVRASLP